MIKFIIIDQNKSFTKSIIDLFMDELKLDNRFVNCCIYESHNYLWKIRVHYPHDKIYFIDYSFGTYQNVAQLQVEIYPQKSQDKYDQNLEELKIATKNTLLKLWQNSKCLWLEDEQSLQLSRKLYSIINKTENDLRHFINIVMAETYGITWWDALVPDSLNQKYRGRMPNYKRDVPSFKNVMDYLISIDADDLLEIILLKKKQWEPVRTEAIEQAINNNTPERLIELLKQQQVMKIDLWDLIFSKYLEEGFLEEWKDFCKNRNHVAHNKLLDYSAFKIISEKTIKVLVSIDNAMKSFKNNRLSDEEQDENRRDLENLIEEQDFKAETKSRIKDETGVDILEEEQIFDKLKEQIEESVDVIRESIYFRNDLLFKRKALNKDDTNNCLIKIESKIKDSIICIIAKEINLDNDPGSKSSVDLILDIDNKEIASGVLAYINGKVELNEDNATYMPLTVNKLITEEIREFMETVNETINEVFPDPIDEVKDMRHSAIYDGGDDPFGDFCCDECGEEGVIISKSVGELGRCMICGYLNEIQICYRCDAYYSPNYDGSEELCGSCKNYISGLVEKD